MNIAVFFEEFALKMVLEEYFVAKSCLNLAFDFGVYLCCRLKSQAVWYSFVDLGLKNRQIESFS